MQRFWLTLVKILFVNLLITPFLLFPRPVVVILRDIPNWANKLLELKPMVNPVKQHTSERSLINHRGLSPIKSVCWKTRFSVILEAVLLNTLPRR
jgi:hypothetical protein